MNELECDRNLTRKHDDLVVKYLFMAILLIPEPYFRREKKHLSLSDENCKTL